jgi:hypothetical protein
VLGLGLSVEQLDWFPRLRLAVQRSTASLPSTVLVPQHEVARGQPLISVAVSPADLHDPATGILANPLKKGRAWERVGSVSYFDAGRLRFASGVGVRIHGGGSRQTSPVQSFRLHFRRRYGADQFRPGVLFDQSTEPLVELVLNNDLRPDVMGRWWHFNSPLAYDITRRIGGITVQTKPARFFLNSEFVGVYVLSERVSNPFLRAHFGHTRFSWDTPAFDELAAWVSSQTKLTMDAVAEVVDLENLTRWLLSVLFCGTEDAYQGPAQFRDDTKSTANWFFINWDMDQSFMPHKRPTPTPWEQDTYFSVLNQPGQRHRGRRRNDVRSDILTTLLQEDERYRDYYKRLYVEVMNHRLTREFLDERYAVYRTIATTYGVTHLEYLPVLRDYLSLRPASLRRMTERHLGTGASYRTTIVAPEAAQVMVDGHEVRSGFEGYYFPGMVYEVAVTGPARERFGHWLINGARLASRAPVLQLRAEADFTIEVVLRPAT